MSRIPMGMTSRVGGSPMDASGWIDRYGPGIPNRGVGAQMIADKWGLSRTQMDEFAVASRDKAANAQDGGRFESQIVPIAGVTADEGIRRGGSVARLGQLKPAVAEGGSVTAGNASQISDGSAALPLMTSEKAAELGLTPIARVTRQVDAGQRQTTGCFSRASVASTRTCQTICRYRSSR